MIPIPVHLFEPVTDRTYLVFAPEQGGWHTGEWWTIDGPGRWVLVYDASVELIVSHVMDAPPDPLDAVGVLQWAMTRQLPAKGSA